MDYKNIICQLLMKELNIENDSIEASIQIQDYEVWGDFTIPCYKIRGLSEKNPNIIASKLSEKISSVYFEKIQNVGPYLNFYINKRNFIEAVIIEVFENKIYYGKKYENKNKKIFIGGFYNKGKDSLDETNIPRIRNCYYSLFRYVGFEVITSDDFKYDVETIYSKSQVALNRIESILSVLKDNGAIYSNDETKIILLKDFNMAPLVLMKKDSSITKSCKDLMLLLYNNERYNFYKGIFLNDKSKKTYYEKLIKAAEYVDSNLKDKMSFIGLERRKLRESSVINFKENEVAEECSKKESVIYLFQDQYITYIKNVYLDAKDVIDLASNTVLCHYVCEKQLNIKYELAKKLNEFNDVIDDSVVKLDVSILNEYIFDITNILKKQCKILREAIKEEQFIDMMDLDLIKATYTVLNEGLIAIGMDFFLN